jgi:hypothetical protein
MHIRITSLLAVALVGCAQPKVNAPGSERAALLGQQRRTMSVSAFSFIGRQTTVEAAVARLGPPDARLCIGEGHDCLVYELGWEDERPHRLAVGGHEVIELNTVAIETYGSRIVLVRHRDTVLFEQAM